MHRILDDTLAVITSEQFAARSSRQVCSDEVATDEYAERVVRVRGRGRPAVGDSPSQLVPIISGRLSRTRWIYMYWVDHPPPHFHAFYSGDEAVIAIDDGSVIAGSIPTTALRLVREWLGLHRLELVENWHRASRPESLVAIEPLR